MGTLTMAFLTSLAFPSSFYAMKFADWRLLNLWNLKSTACIWLSTKDDYESDSLNSFNALLKHTSRKSSGSLFIKWPRTNVYPLGTKIRNVAFDLRWTRSPDCHFIPLSYWGWAFQWVQLIFGGAFLVLFLHWTSMQIHRFTFLSQAQSQMRDPHTMINSKMATFLFRTFITHINGTSVLDFKLQWNWWTNTFWGDTYIHLWNNEHCIHLIIKNHTLTL